MYFNSNFLLKKKKNKTWAKHHFTSVKQYVILGIISSPNNVLEAIKLFPVPFLTDDKMHN